jgi:hypothetical protein
MRKQVVWMTLAMFAAAVLAGCTISSGVFVGMAQHSSDTSIGASYASFDGSLARSVPLKEGDVVSFDYEGDEGLHAVVKQDGQEFCEIAEGVAFTAPADGRYAFTVEGKAENGSFSLAWQVE